MTKNIAKSKILGVRPQEHRLHTSSNFTFAHGVKSVEFESIDAVGRDTIEYDGSEVAGKVTLDALELFDMLELEGGLRPLRDDALSKIERAEIIAIEKKSEEVARSVKDTLAYVDDACAKAVAGLE